MNFQGERDPSSGDLHKNTNDSTNVSIDGIGMSNKRRQLDPISPDKLKTQKSKLPGSLTSPKKAKGINQSVTSLNDITDSKELNETETTLEFILLSLAKHLGIKPK